MTKTLLYPFSIDRPYFEGYAWAFELSVRMKARLQLFTTTPVHPDARQYIYHSLLEAHGYYMQHYSHAAEKSHDVIREPLIAAGALDVALVSHLKGNPIDIVIIDPSTSIALAKSLNAIVSASGGVIVLPPGRASNTLTPADDKFYDDLRRARLYKLPSTFFFTLGKDNSAFNYLRKFFQKKSFLKLLPPRN